MSPDAPGPADSDDPLADALLEYFRAAEAGQAISPTEFLARYPDLADELKSFLGDQPRLASLLAPLHFPGDFQDEELPRRLGDYELLERIGGHMGAVYRAEQISLKRTVAVKVLRRLGDDDKRRFREEAEAMAALKHDHIVPIYEVSEADGLPFFSMEWYAGGSLTGRLEQLKKCPSRAAEIVAQVARAVHFAHQNDIWHRDLKPDNILLDEKGRPHVADFGLALRTNPEEDRDGSERAPAGTPAYLAPEQLAQKPAFNDASDVHGLGALLYALLTGHAPFEGGTPREVLRRAAESAPEPPSRRNKRVDAGLEAICMKCLAKDPDARYASAADVADDLERYLRGEPPLAQPLGILGRVGYFVRQARNATEFETMALSLLFQALAVLLLNGAAFLLLRYRGPEALVWPAVFGSYLPLFVMFFRARARRGGRFSAGERHLWSIWLGHFLATLAVFVALRLNAGEDAARGFAAGYAACAGLNGLAFFVMGSLFAGLQYTLGAAWMAAAVLMGVTPEWAPLEYGLLMAACSLFTGAHLNRIARALSAGEDEPEVGHAATVTHLRASGEVVK